MTEFVKSPPVWTVSISGAPDENGQMDRSETIYVGLWERTNDRDGSIYYSGKTEGGRWVNLNKFKSKEQRQKERDGVQEEPRW